MVLEKERYEAFEGGRCVSGFFGCVSGVFQSFLEVFAMF